MTKFSELSRLIITSVIMGIRFAIQIKGYKTFFLIDDNTAYGKSVVKFFKEYAIKYGGEILGEESIRVGEKDFTAVLTKAKQLKPDVIYFGGLATEGALIKLQMFKLGLKAEFFSPGGIFSQSFIDAAGEAAEGTMCFAEGLPLEKIPGGLKFIEDYKKAGFKDPYEAFGIFGYVSAQVLIEAIEKAGPNRRAVIEEMKKGTYDTAIGKVSFDEYGENKLRMMSFHIVKNGQWVPLYYTNPDGELVRY